MVEQSLACVDCPSSLLPGSCPTRRLTVRGRCIGETPQPRPTQQSHYSAPSFHSLYPLSRPHLRLQLDLSPQLQNSACWVAPADAVAPRHHCHLTPRGPNWQSRLTPDQPLLLPAVRNPHPALIISLLNPCRSPRPQSTVLQFQPQSLLACCTFQRLLEGTAWTPHPLVSKFPRAAPCSWAVRTPDLAYATAGLHLCSPLQLASLTTSTPTPAQGLNFSPYKERSPLP